MNTNELFEEIFHECNIEQLFEQVLKETVLSNYESFGIFQIDILQGDSSSRKPLLKSTSFEEIIRIYDAKEQYRNCVILPCKNNGILLSNNTLELKNQVIELELEKEKTYKTTLSYLVNYRKVLENHGLLNVTRQLNTDNTNAYKAMEQRTNTDINNQ
jgi:hypothetical protein